MKHFILFLLAIPLFALKGNAFTLSEKAEISILTCSPGTELYSLFGHTAIRILIQLNNTTKYLIMVLLISIPPIFT